MRFCCLWGERDRQGAQRSSRGSYAVTSEANGVQVEVILSLVIVTAARLAWPGATDDREVLFNEYCQLCHTPERVHAKRLTKEAWQQIITDDRGWRPAPRCHDEPAARA